MQAQSLRLRGFVMGDDRMYNRSWPGAKMESWPKQNRPVAGLLRSILVTPLRSMQGQACHCKKIQNLRINMLGLPSLRRFLLGAGLLLSTISGVRGQTEASTGVISGTVRDQASGLLVASTVQAHH